VAPQKALDFFANLFVCATLPVQIGFTIRAAERQGALIDLPDPAELFWSHGEKHPVSIAPSGRKIAHN
jgi:hypothetical protein